MTGGDQAVRDAEAMLARREMAGVTDAFDRAQALGAEADRCSGGRWMAAMLVGDFAAAWRESDAIRWRGGHDPHRLWNGEDLRGRRVMVRSLHGFGDAVQMLRYAPRLRELTGSVTYEVAPRLVELARCFPEVEEVVTWGEGAPANAPAWDVQVELMELPYVLRTALPELPLATCYLKLPRIAVEAAATIMQSGRVRRFRIGIMCSAGGWNPERRLPLTLAETMLEELNTGDVELWSLHHGAEGPEISGIRRATTECGDGLAALAATIANLDLVMTADTVSAHLAGALGKPVWVMLQYAADWRWMVNRVDSPWYPSARLFRQPQPGDWAGMADQVRAALHELFPAPR